MPLTLPTLHTPRLVIRPPQESDIPAMPGVFHDEEIYAYTRNIPYPYGEPEARHAINRYAQLARDGRALALFPQERLSAAMIGLVILAIDSAKNEAELGYAIGRAWWGRGYATEACQALIKHGFEVLQLERLVAHAMVRNPASSRVLEKVGMQPIGVIDGLCEKDGKRHDARGFEMTRDAWADTRLS